MIDSDSATQRFPLISVGMPIHNEERFLAESLESLLSQSYPNLEILISDNASTDGSARICGDFADRNDNILVHRFDTNQGAVANFRNVLDRAQGDYFMWASGHDLWSPDYIQRCFEAIRDRPDSVLAFGSTSWVDDQGRPHRKESGWTDTRGMHAIARYMVVYWGNMNPVLGLIRTSALRDCKFRETAGADLVILTQLALAGDFVHADKTSWSRREFREETDYSDKLKRYKSQHYGLDRSRLGRLFPLARLPLELLRVVFACRLPVVQKFLLSTLLIVNLPVKYVTDKWFR
jgi:glycosyltransferase involved in cell wall biosynthesis